MYVGAEQELGDLGISFKEIFKKVEKAVIRPIGKAAKKIAPKVLAPLGVALAPITGGASLAVLAAKPQWLGLKSAKAKKDFRKWRKGTLIAAGVGAAVAGAIVAGPAIAAAVSKGASVAMGGLKWVGGKLIAAPKALVDFVAKQGKDIKAMSPEEVLNTASQLGLVTEGQVESAADQAEVALEQGQLRPIEAGMGTAMPLILIGGVVIVALAMGGGRRAGR